MRQALKRIYRLSLAILIIIPLFVTLGFVGAISFIDFNRYKPQIEAEVLEKTGRHFNIEGAIEVSAIPFEIQIGESILENPEGFESEQPQMRFHKIHLSLSVQELLFNKKLQIQSLTLIEPEVFLIRNAEGVDNWTTLPGIKQWVQQQRQLHSRLQFEADDSKVLTSTTASEFSFATQDLFANNENAQQPEQESWRFESLIVENGKVILLDDIHKYDVQFNDLNVFALDVSPNHPFEVRTNFNYHHSLSKRHFKVRVNGLAQNAGSVFEWQVRDIQGLMNVEIKSEQEVPETRFGLNAETITFDVRSRQLAMQSLNMDGLSGKMTVNLSGQLGREAAFSGEIAASDVNAEMWSKHLGVEIVESQQKALKGKVLNGEFAWSWNPEGMQLEKAK